MNHLLFVSSFTQKIFIVPIDLYFETENEKKIIKEKISKKEILKMCSFDSTKTSYSDITVDDKINFQKKNIIFTNLLTDDWEKYIRFLKKKVYMHYNTKLCSMRMIC